VLRSPMMVPNVEISVAIVCRKVNNSYATNAADTSSNATVLAIMMIAVSFRLIEMS
jgi:hypothetical protein